MDWENMREAHHFMRDDFEQDAAERAYRRGCEHGYRKAMEEMHGSYGERGHFMMRGTYGERGPQVYGERQPQMYGQPQPPMYGERQPQMYGQPQPPMHGEHLPEVYYGERQGVPGTGPYGHR